MSNQGTQKPPAIESIACMPRFSGLTPVQHAACGADGFFGCIKNRKNVGNHKFIEKPCMQESSWVIGLDMPSLLSEKKNDHPIFRPFRFPPLLQGHAALEAEIFGDDIYADSPLQDSDQGVGTGASPPAARAVVM